MTTDNMKLDDRLPDPPVASVAAAAPAPAGDRVRGELAALLRLPLTVLLVVIAGITVLISLLPASQQHAGMVMLVTAVLVVALHTFTGNSGVLSFGHIGFAAIGAYACALLTIPEGIKGTQLPGLPGFLASAELTTVPAVLLAGVAAGVVAAVIGSALMRLTGLAAGIATLSVLVIVYVVIAQWDGLTHGLQSLSGVPANTTLWSSFAWLVAAILVAYRFQRSRVGLELRASREDAIAAEAIGIDVHRRRYFAFVLSGMMAGVGGALYAQMLGALSPETLYFDVTFVTVAMLLIGGMGSLGGAVIGAVFVSAVTEVTRLVEQGVAIGSAEITAPAGSQGLVLAVLMLVVLIVRPRGLTGGRELAWPRRRAAQSADAAGGA